MNKETKRDVGMLFFREAGKHADGTDLMMVIGIVPKKALSKEIKGERQYPVVVVDDHMYIHRAYPYAVYYGSHLARATPDCPCCV